MASAFLIGLMLEGEGMAEPTGKHSMSEIHQASWRQRLGSPGLERDWDYLRRLLLTLVVLGLAYFLWRISGILLLLFAAVLLAVLLRAFADLIARHTPIPEQWTLTAAILIVAILAAAFLVLFGSQIWGQIAQVFERLPDAIDAVGSRIGISNASEELESTISSNLGPGVLSRAAGLGYTVAGALADLALAVIASIYLAADPRLYRRGVAKLLPPSQHARIFDAMDVTGKALRLWFAGQLVTMVLVGLASGLAYWWIGLPSPVALATIAAVTNFVPFVGPILGAIPALVFALTMDLQSLLWTVGWILTIQQIEGNVITPFIQKRAVAIPPVVVLFAIGVFGLLFGLPGIFLAVPLAVAITVLVKKLWVRQTLGEDTSVPGEETPSDDAMPKAK
ncbi:AI-2E family transporter [Microvirga arabica]|nr:AI-2E family transporter [Microvirga arabica]MBM1173750.1 AI-2E family transporter [Microvirga arabica]